MKKKIPPMLKHIKKIYASYPRVQEIIYALSARGARVLLVGGAVRDMLMSIPIKDLDFELYNLPLDTIESILSSFGPVSVVGKSFGVLRVHGLDVDWSLPRTDSAGRKPLVSVDPYMPFNEAFKRRDLTINAMGIDMYTGELIDPYGGQEDLAKKILRAPDVRMFVEDPLRFYRVMQFVGRFDMSVHSSLAHVCSTMDLKAISRDRIEAEFEKLLLKAKRPSLGLRWLRDVGRLQELLPELYDTIDVPQRPDYHPEGDVFEHTMQAVDAAAIIIQSYDDQERKLILMYAALCHDLGKKDTTEWVDERWRSIGHEKAGVPLVKAMLARITGKKKIIQSVAKLVYHHMSPGSYVECGAKEGTYKMLAYKLAPDATMALLADLFCADRQGRNGVSHEPLMAIDEDVCAFKERAKEAGVLEHPEEPVLLGADMLGMVAPGPALGEILEHAYEIQLRKGIRDKEVLKKRVLKKSAMN